MQIHVQIVTGSIGSDDDLFDERANATHRLFLRFFVRKAFDELRDSSAITLSHARFDQCRLNVCGSQFGFDGVAAIESRVEVSLDLARIHGAGANRFDELVSLSHNLVEFLFEHAAI